MRILQKIDLDQLASFDAKLLIPLDPRIPVASAMELYGEWAGEDNLPFMKTNLPDSWQAYC